MKGDLIDLLSSRAMVLDVIMKAITGSEVVLTMLSTYLVTVYPPLKSKPL